MVRMTVAPDVRMEYLEEVASMVLRFKPDKWSKLVGAEENMALFTEFLEKADVRVLVLTLNPAGFIVPCLGFPESLKSKGVYFIKTEPESVTKTNYKTHLLYGDLSPTPVEQLMAIVEEVGRAAAPEGCLEPRGWQALARPCTHVDSPCPCPRTVWTTLGPAISFPN